MKVGRKRVDGDAASRTVAAASIAALLVAALAGGGAGCSGPGKTFTKSMVLGGKKVSPGPEHPVPPATIAAMAAVAVIAVVTDFRAALPPIFFRPTFIEISFSLSSNVI